MQIVFRVDASVELGTGHLMRCLSLALALRKAGKDVTFFSRELSEPLRERIVGAGCQLVELRELNQKESHPNLEEDPSEFLTSVSSLSDVKVVIVDHYKISQAWESEVKARLGCQIMVIDDLANRKHSCDILLDQNFHEDPFSRYRELVPAKCVLLLGPSFALLREEFAILREKVRVRESGVKKVLVMYGGSDPTSETLKAIAALEELPMLEVSVVVGPANLEKEEIRRACDSSGFKFHFNIDKVGELMAESDIMLGAGGVTTWERFCMGLPGLVTLVSENQVASGIDCERAGLQIVLGLSESVSPMTIKKKVTGLFEAPEEVSAISIKCMNSTDGKGVYRVMDELKRFL